jgi:hypothetical protein
MWMLMYGVAGVLFLAGLACFLMVVVHAFRESTVQGLLSLLVPFYALYYGVVRFQHAHKGLIVAGMVVAPLLAAVTANSATAVFGPDVTADDPAFDDDLGDFDDDLGDF